MTFHVSVLPQARRDIDRNADWWADHHSTEQALRWSDAVPLAPPFIEDKPAIFRTGFTLPKDKPAILDMHVTHYPMADWQLVVKVNGEVIH